MLRLARSQGTILVALASRGTLPRSREPDGRSRLRRPPTRRTQSPVSDLRVQPSASLILPTAERRAVHLTSHRSRSTGARRREPVGVGNLARSARVGGPFQRGGDNVNSASRVGISGHQNTTRPLARSGGTRAGVRTRFPTPTGVHPSTNCHAATALGPLSSRGPTLCAVATAHGFFMYRIALRFEVLPRAKNVFQPLT